MAFKIVSLLGNIQFHKLASYRKYGALSSVFQVSSIFGYKCII